MFKELKNRYVITGELLLKTPLHVGSGSGSNETDATIIRYSDGFPYVPGSSFKGVLRSTVERIAPLFGFDVCSLFGSNSCEERLREHYSDFVKEGRDEEDILRLLKGQGKDSRGQPINIEQCDVCWLFGSPFIASKVFVEDLKVNGYNPSRKEIRDGVGIDRDTGTAVEKVKYDYEVLPACFSFNLKITVENASEGDHMLLAFGLSEFLWGTRLGGLTSRGLGNCIIQNGTVESIDFNPANLGQAVDYLTTGRLPITQTLEDYVRNKLQPLKPKGGGSNA